MTDKELKKLSRLELLELLLTVTRENELLKAELENLKQVNTIEKSAEHLNETSKQLETALKKVSSIISTGDKDSDSADKSDNDTKQKKKNKKERKKKKKSKIENS